MPLTPDEARLVERLARLVAGRGMTTPAVLFLESSKPVAFLGGQSLRFLEPLAGALLPSSDLAVAASILEDRDKVEALIRKIEELGHAPAGAPSAPAATAATAPPPATSPTDERGRR